MRKLGLLKENSGVSVVALAPDNVKKLTPHYAILVEKGAGDLTGFSDHEYALALLPRTTKAQSMDILSSQATMSGYQAVINGFNKSNVIAPMISSAEGTRYPAKVVIIKRSFESWIRRH